MPLFDVHAHLTHERLVSDVDEVLARAAAARVTSVVSNGLNLADNQAVLAMAAKHSCVKPALGLYPVDAVLKKMRQAGVDYPDQRQCWSADEAIDWLQANVDEAFAVGEIGLDGYWVPPEFWEEQEKAFRRLVRIAMKHDKAIIIHTRKREQRAREVLEELGADRVCWHCFGGKVKLARAIAVRGDYFSIPANARRSEAFTRMLQTLPKDQILLETDCPYLGPEKSRRNEPANVSVTLAYISELWKIPIADVEARLAANFERLFGTPP